MKNLEEDRIIFPYPRHPRNEKPQFHTYMVILTVIGKCWETPSAPEFGASYYDVCSCRSWYVHLSRVRITDLSKKTQFIWVIIKIKASHHNTEMK